jgi:cytochrome c-type biogenesis protein CcmH/NrfG
MAIEESAAPQASGSLRPWRVYSMAAIYLIAGLVIGFVLHTSRATVSAAVSAPAARSERPAPVAPSNSNPHSSANLPSLDQMKQMADREAAPLFAKLKNDPNNSATLTQLGSIYHAAHQFKEAAAYYDRAAQADSKNVAARNKLAISLYREGDVDGAIAQLNRALQDAPGDANALFNLGMIRLQGKQDGAGALVAWQQLLKSNPKLSEDRKAEVKKLMADVNASLAGQKQDRGARQ